MFRPGDRVVSTGYYKVRGTIRAVSDRGGVVRYDIVWDTDHERESLNVVAEGRNLQRDKEIDQGMLWSWVDGHIREIDVVTRLAELEDA